MPINWDHEAELLYKVLFPHVEGAVHAAVLTGWRMLEVEDEPDWRAINAVARQWAQAHTFALVKGITDTTRAIYQDAFATWFGTGAPLGDLVDALTPWLGPVRAEMVAVTEVTNIYAQGNLLGWKESGVVEEAVIMTAEDALVCDICEPHDGQTRALDSTDVPAFHVRCRCWLKPVVNAAKWLARWRGRNALTTGERVAYPPVLVRAA